MEEIVKLRRGDTLIGLFDRLNEPGDIIHLQDKDRKYYQSLRTGASTKNDRARLLKEIESYQVKFSVLRTLKENHTSLVYVDHSKEEDS